MFRPHYARRFVRAPQVTQQQVDVLTQQIEQTERAIRSGLFGDEQWSTDPYDDDWDWAASSIDRAWFAGWTAADFQACRKAQAVGDQEWFYELPRDLRADLRDKLMAAGGSVDICGFFAHATLPVLKKRRTILKRQLRGLRSRMEAK